MKLPLALKYSSLSFNPTERVLLSRNPGESFLVMPLSLYKRVSKAIANTHQVTFILFDTKPKTISVNTKIINHQPSRSFVFIRLCRKKYIRTDSDG